MGWELGVGSWDGSWDGMGWDEVEVEGGKVREWWKGLQRGGGERVEWGCGDVEKGLWVRGWGLKTSVGEDASRWEVRQARRVS